MIVARDRHRPNAFFFGPDSCGTTFRVCVEVLAGKRLDIFAGMFLSAAAAAPFVAMSALAAIANGAIIIMVFRTA